MRPARSVSSWARPTASAARATGPIEIDGILDDATWAAAPVIDEFWQQKPDAGMPATERTEVRILFDDEHLYIGAELMDQPGASNGSDTGDGPKE